jgi:iron complex transport system substrate-binding protein
VRLVSLTCSNTEIVCALGAGELLVGVDDHSDYPVETLSRLPRVGPDLDIDVERVAALKPDLVLASLTVPGHERVLDRLQRARLPFIAPEPRTLQDVFSDIRLIGARLDLASRAEALVSDLSSELGMRAATTGLRVLIEWWPKPVIAPCQQSWTNELLAFAGAENPLADRPYKSQPITDEEAAALAPDISIISWCGVRTEKYRPSVVLRRPAWQKLELVRQRRVYPVSEAWLGRPGPRLVFGARALAQIVAEVAAGR